MSGAHIRDTVIDLNFYRDWLAKRKKDRDQERKKPTCFITISREFGCEGYELSQLLVKKLSEPSGSDWNLFTRREIEEFAASDEMDREMVHEISERRWSFKDWFVDALVPDYLLSHSSVVFVRMKNFILNLADRGNCVILGAGSQIVTHRLDPKKFMGIHVRIVASYPWRLKRIEKLYGLSREESEATLKKRQDSRDKFIEDFSGMNAADLSLYHIAFNNANSTAEVMADTIISYMKSAGAID